MKITKEFLASVGKPACQASLDVFEALFPYGAEITQDNVSIAENANLPLAWIIFYKTSWYFQQKIIEVLHHPTEMMMDVSSVLIDNLRNESNRINSLFESNAIAKEDAESRIEDASKLYKSSFFAISDLYRKAMRLVDIEMLNAYVNDDGTTKEFDEKVITSSSLIKNKPYACEKQVELFCKLYPDGFVINKENIKNAESDGLYVHWFIVWKIPLNILSIVSEYTNLVYAMKEELVALYNKRKADAIKFEQDLYDQSCVVLRTKEEIDYQYDKFLEAIDLIDKEYHQSIRDLENEHSESIWLLTMHLVNAYGLE